MSKRFAHWGVLAALVMGAWVCLASGALAGESDGTTGDPVVRGVFFYSPTCGHCEYIATQVFPPLFEQYGDQLQVIGIDTSQESGGAFFFLALEKFGLTEGYVPMLVVGEEYMVGSGEIPERFPGLIEEGLAAGGVDWPDIPEMDTILESAFPPEGGTTTTAAVIGPEVPTTDEGEMTPVTPSNPGETSDESIVFGLDLPVLVGGLGTLVLLSALGVYLLRQRR